MGLWWIDTQGKKFIPAANICMTRLIWNGLGSNPGLRSDRLPTERLSPSPSLENQDTSIMFKVATRAAQCSFKVDHLQRVQQEVVRVL